MNNDNDDDIVIETGGFTFCIAADLLKAAEGVTIDLSYMGITAEPRVPLAALMASFGCGSCDIGGSCGISGC